MNEIIQIQSNENLINDRLINREQILQTKDQAESKRVREATFLRELSALRRWSDEEGSTFVQGLWDREDLAIWPAKKGFADHSFYCDGRFGLILLRNQSGLAIAGFDINDQLGIIEVMQLQGARGNRSLPHRWERGLLRTVENYAGWRNRQGGNTSSIEVIPAAELHWVKMGRLDLGVARLRYDVTAKRLGYKLNPDTGVFEKAMKLEGPL